MTNPMTHIHDETGEYDRAMSDVEFASYTAGRLAYATEATTIATADATFAKDRADGLAKLELAGLTIAQAEAVARKKP